MIVTPPSSFGMVRVALIFLTQLLLWVLVAQANHALSGLHVYLFASGLFIAYPALAFGLREGMIVSFLGGLLCDANVALAPDLSRSALALAHTHALLFVCAHAIIYHLRDRLPREETFARVLVVLFSNLGIFLVFSLAKASRLPASAEIWPRLIVDLACSQVFLVLIAPWFFALQRQVLALANVQRESLAKSP
ncbi:MAG: hypothetical protein ABUL68_05140 [Pseudomonadota bacterium]